MSDNAVVSKNHTSSCQKNTLRPSSSSQGNAKAIVHGIAFFCRSEKNLYLCERFIPQTQAMKRSFSCTLLYLAMITLLAACAGASTDDMISDAETCVADGRYDKALSVTRSCIENDSTLTVGQKCRIAMVQVTAGARTDDQGAIAEGVKLIHQAYADQPDSVRAFVGERILSGDTFADETYLLLELADPASAEYHDFEYPDSLGVSDFAVADDE